VEVAPHGGQSSGKYRGENKNTVHPVGGGGAGGGDIPNLKGVHCLVYSIP
jgi:hypothetical protein